MFRKGTGATRVERKFAGNVGGALRRWCKGIGLIVSGAVSLPITVFGGRGAMMRSLLLAARGPAGSPRNSVSSTKNTDSHACAVTPGPEQRPPADAIGRHGAAFRRAPDLQQATGDAQAQPMVTFTFDDVPASACEIGARILEQHGERGTFYVAAQACGKVNSGRTSAASIDQLQKSMGEWARDRLPHLYPPAVRS